MEGTVACDGYEHNSRVILIRDLPNVDVSIGSNGTVVNVNKDQHTIDVQFDMYQVYNNLDPSAFELDTEEPEPLTITAGA